MKGIRQKGFYPLFTTLGLLLVVMVVAMAIQWNAFGNSAYDLHMDRLSWLRINSAVGNVKAIAISSLKQTFYDAVTDVGKIGNGTVNRYLNYSKAVGWETIVSDIRSRVSNGFNSAVPKLADYSDGHQSTFAFEEGINVTIGELTGEGISLKEDESGIVGVVELPMAVTNRYQGWQATVFESNITIPLNVRLKDMYERAWDFNSNYANYAMWTFTCALYARAYLNAYGSTTGPLLKEAHYDFDPVATLLFGNIETLQDFGKDMSSALDIGAVPAATWLAEWQFLSEPSFLPAGFDMTAEDEEKAKGAIENNYRMGEIEDEVCSNASNPGCSAIYDTSELSDRVDYLDQERDKYSGLLDLMGGWLDEYNTSAYDKCATLCEDAYTKCLDKCKPGSKGKTCRQKCEDKYDECRESGREASCMESQLNSLFGTDNGCDSFRDAAKGAINDILLAIPGLDEAGCVGTTEEPQDRYTDSLEGVDPQVTGEFEENDETFGFHETKGYCTGADGYLSDLNSLAVVLTPERIDDNLCKIAKSADCEADSGCEDEDCDAHCRYPQCPAGGSSYECPGDAETGARRSGTCTVCGDGGCDKETYSIDQCTCRCRPSIDLLKRINADFSGLYTYAEKAYIATDDAYNDLKTQLDRREASDRLMDTAQSLGSNELGYDVFSRIDANLVKYDQGVLGGKECYFNPTYRDKDSGVCGDSTESAVVYTVQIAAAALATLFTGGAASPIMEYAVDFFPAIFESEARYNLTETLIDDGNRAILENLGSEGSELYTYAPFQFEIYRDKEFDIGSATMDRLFVYIYLPSVSGGMKRILTALADSSCTGESC